MMTRNGWVLAVYMVVRNRRGEVLLLRRSQSARHFPGLWELPGGKPVPGENFAKTAELEVSEETGLYVPPSGVAGAVYAKMPGRRVAMLILEGRTTESTITLSAEHDTFCWISPAQAPSLKLRPGFDTFFARYTAAAPAKRSRTARPQQAKAPARAKQ